MMNSPGITGAKPVIDLVEDGADWMDEVEKIGETTAVTWTARIYSKGFLCAATAFNSKSWTL
jgi:hypothetical protein